MLPSRALRNLRRRLSAMPRNPALLKLRLPSYPSLAWRNRRRPNCRKQRSSRPRRPCLHRRHRSRLRLKSNPRQRLQNRHLRPKRVIDRRKFHAHRALVHLGDARLREPLLAAPDHLYGAVSPFGVLATRAAWTEGDEWQRAAVARLDANRHVLAELLAGWPSLAGPVYVVPQATYLAWLDFRALGLGDDPAATFAEAGVELSSGPDFGDDGAGFARLNFATSPGMLARARKRREAARERGKRQIGNPQHQTPLSFRPSEARAGIHNTESWLWIPGSLAYARAPE